jgi:hypothetical protein
LTKEASLDVLEHLLVVDGPPDSVLTTAAAQDATAQLVRLNRERLLKSIEAQRARFKNSTTR